MTQAPSDDPGYGSAPTGPAGSHARIFHGTHAHGPDRRHHPSILTLAIAFFVGLVAMPLIIFPFIPQFASASAEYGNLLRNMQILSGILTLLYVILRRSEGDFRSLFMLTVGLFAATEAFTELSYYFGIPALHALEMLFAFALFMYSCLTLAAAIAEERRGDWFHHALVNTVIGFIILSAVRFYYEKKGALYEDHGRRFTFIVMLLLALQLAVLVVWAEIRARRKRGEHPANP